MEQPTADSQYPTTYTDARGIERTIITNDSDTLRMRLRDVDFVGDDFDSLSPVEGTSADQLRQFTLQQGALCACRIECQMPVPIGGRIQSQGTLLMSLTLGEPAPNAGLDREDLHLILEFDGRRFASPGKSGWFEDELRAIQKQLPEGIYMKACINCLYADYSPLGHGLFGGTMCFRNVKEEYRKVTTKNEFWSVHGRQDRLVQETYLCPQFERRVPGTGYRG